jgi:hypothetical protein
MVKIFAKFTLPYLFEERAIGGANDPRVGVQHLLRTESLKFAVLEHSQDFHLCERTHIGDLVEKERTLVRQLEFPFDRLCAPVNAPRSCPKSWLSINVSLMAEALKATKARSARAEEL